MSLAINALAALPLKEKFFADDSKTQETTVTVTLEEKKDEAPKPKGWTAGSIFQAVLGLLIGVYAAYLSWSCNSKLEYSTLAKIIFSFFAFIFGGIYLILFAIMRMDACNRLPEPAPVMSSAY